MRILQSQKERNGGSSEGEEMTFDFVFPENSVDLDEKEIRLLYIYSIYTIYMYINVNVY